METLRPLSELEEQGLPLYPINLEKGWRLLSLSVRTIHCSEWDRYHLIARTVVGYRELGCECS